MLTDLRSVLGRHTLIELMIAFAVATAVVAFVSQIVNGLIVYPITDAAQSGNPTNLVTTGYGPLQFVIANRVFDTQGILTSGLVLLVLLALVAIYIRFHEDVLWRPDDAVATCPHCLSEIPAGARVCSQCTRDIGAASTPG